MTRQALEELLRENTDVESVRNALATVEKAKAFALKAHGDQKYGDEPYIVHLEATEGVMIEFDFVTSPDRAAALLHDLEDTAFDGNDLRAEGFPEETVLMVEAVTKPKGTTRKEANLVVYPRIRAYPRAIRLKLADRIANSRQSKANSPGLYQMYVKEYPAFRSALYSPGMNTDPMWRELDHLMGYTQLAAQFDRSQR